MKRPTVPLGNRLVSSINSVVVVRALSFFSFVLYVRVGRQNSRKHIARLFCICHFMYVSMYACRMRVAKSELGERADFPTDFPSQVSWALLVCVFHILYPMCRPSRLMCPRSCWCGRGFGRVNAVCASKIREYCPGRWHTLLGVLVNIQDSPSPLLPHSK